MSREEIKLECLKMAERNPKECGNKTILEIAELLYNFISK